MEKVKFYYNPMSRGRIVHWMLEEVGAPYEIELLEWGKHRSPEFLKINPMGKIPAIVHRDVVVTETPAICTYLADAFPQASMAPPINDPLRGSYYRWLFFAASCIEPAMLDKSSPRSNAPKASHLGYGSYEDVVRILENLVANGFVVGGRFSTVDLFLSANLEWVIFTKSLDPKPVFTDYIRLCQDRPSHKRFTEQAEKLKNP